MSYGSIANLVVEMVKVLDAAQRLAGPALESVSDCVLSRVA